MKLGIATIGLSLTVCACAYGGAPPFPEEVDGGSLPTAPTFWTPGVDAAVPVDQSDQATNPYPVPAGTIDDPNDLPGSQRPPSPKVQ
jgi:hypothetical protein